MEQNTYYIAQYCHITDTKAIVNGSVVAKATAPNFNGFLRELYQDHQCKYPKFFKMDALSKLAFLGAEFMLPKMNDTDFKSSRTALVFSNRSSSLETDKKHQASITSIEAYPSPGVFVYTLPNIGMGEIAIRHQLQTENAFFVFETFQAELLQKYTVSLLKDDKCDQVLCGWVEVHQEERHGFFYVVNTAGKWAHTPETIQEFFELI